MKGNLKGSNHLALFVLKQTDSLILFTTIPQT